MFNALLSHATSINLWRLNLHTIIDQPTNKVIYIFVTEECKLIATMHYALHLPIVQWNINMKYLSSQRNHHILSYQLLVHKRNLIL